MPTFIKIGPYSTLFLAAVMLGTAAMITAPDATMSLATGLVDALTGGAG